jgi:hypothetical protein
MTSVNSLVDFFSQRKIGLPVTANQKHRTQFTTMSEPTTPLDESSSQDPDLSVHASPTQSRARKGSYRARAHSNADSSTSEPYKNDTRTLHNKVEHMFEEVATVIQGEMQGNFLN